MGMAFSQPCSTFAITGGATCGSRCGAEWLQWLFICSLNGMSQPDALFHSVNADASTTQHRHVRQFPKRFSLSGNDWFHQFYWHVEQPHKCSVRIGRLACFLFFVVFFKHASWCHTIRLNRQLTGDQNKCQEPGWVSAFVYISWSSR